jgi:hypothetical protein
VTDGRWRRLARRRALLVAAPAIVGAVLGLVVARLDPPRRSAAEQRYTIEPGTAARVAAGLPIAAILPARLATRVGETLVVANADTTSHVLGPFVLQPGQSWSQRFALAGEYPMTCSLYPNTDLVIAVAPSGDRPHLATAVHRAWAVGWLALCAAVVVLLVGAIAAAGTGGTGTPTGRADGDGTRRSPGEESGVATLARLVPGTAAGLVILDAVALSRVAPWAAVARSPALVWWITVVGVAVAVPGLVGLAAQEVRWRRHLLAGAVVAVVVAAGIGVVSWLGAMSVGVGLGVLALGLALAAIRVATPPK